MAEDMGTAGSETLQSKDAVNYRLGGDVCHVCMYYVPGQGEEGTCRRVAGAIHGHDVCDVFRRAASAAEEDREQPDDGAAAMGQAAQRMAKRGMISDRAMAGLRGGGY